MVRLAGSNEDYTLLHSCRGLLTALLFWPNSAILLHISRNPVEQCWRAFASVEEGEHPATLASMAAGVQDALGGCLNEVDYCQ